MDLNFQYYTALVTIDSVMLAVLIFGTMNNYLVSRRKLHCFHMLFLDLILLNWLEWASVMFRTAGNPEFVPLHYAVRFCEFALTPCLPILALYIFGKPKKIIFLPCVINIILQIVALFTPFIYYIDKTNNDYVRLSATYPLYLATFVVPAVIMFVVCIGFSKKYQHKNLIFLILIMLSCFSATAMSAFMPKLKLDWAIISVTSVLFYVYMVQLLLQTDSLTRLLNRKSFDYSTKKINSSATVVIFDVDSFKKINDTYGHTYGDYCLEKIAEVIKHEFSGKADCYRSGGDEMVAISKKPLENVGEILKNIDNGIANIETNGEKFCVSAGYANYIHGRDDLQKVIEKADEMMYKCKAVHYAVQNEKSEKAEETVKESETV